ncbi:MAG: ygbF [Betaproteobacteria bacterium]|nr:ygbF [Betaproteobacteria bacterium]
MKQFVRSHLNRAALLKCGAVLLFAAAATSAQGGMFDDDEARKQIAAERKRIDEMTTQQKDVEARLGKVEEAFKSQALLDLFTQIESLKAEMNKLRGQIEVLNNNVENTSKRQRDMYLDLDTRVRRFEQQGGPPASEAPATTAPTAGGAAPPAAATAAGSAPPTTVATDSAAETRAYEAAQGLRRVGNYQGAIVSFQNFIKQYPKSNLAPRAQYWIGDSYFNLRDFKLAIASQQTLLKIYPDSPSVPDAMLNIASSQIEMGETVVGRKTLEELVSKYPVSEAAEKAKRRIGAAGSGASSTANAPAGKP